MFFLSKNTFKEATMRSKISLVLAGLLGSGLLVADEATTQQATQAPSEAKKTLVLHRCPQPSRELASMISPFHELLIIITIRPGSPPPGHEVKEP